MCNLYKSTFVHAKGEQYTYVYCSSFACTNVYSILAENYRSNVFFCANLTVASQKFSYHTSRDYSYRPVTAAIFCQLFSRSLWALLELVPEADKQLAPCSEPAVKMVAPGLRI